MPPKKPQSEPAPGPKTKSRARSPPPPATKKQPRKTAPPKLDNSKKRKSKTEEEGDEDYSPGKGKSRKKPKRENNENEEASSRKSRGQPGKGKKKIKREVQDKDDALEGDDDDEDNDDEDKDDAEAEKDSDEDDEGDKDPSSRKRADLDVDIFEAEQQRFEDIFTSAEKELAEVASGEHATENMIKAVENTFAHYDQAIKNEDANLQKYYATWNKRGELCFNQIARPFTEWSQSHKALIAVLKEAGATYEKRPEAVDAAVAAFEAKQKDERAKVEEHSKALADSRSLIRATRKFLRAVRA